MVNESVKQPQASEHRAVMAEALNTALEVFTAQAEPTFDGIMTNGLWPIADAAGIDRVAINRFFDEDPDRPFGQVYCWAREAGGTTSVDERLRRIPSNHPATARWLSIISADECTVATLSDANEEEAAFMDSFGLKTVVITPIFIHGRLWGFAVFGDLARERHFDGVSLAFLRSAAFLCANMVLRYEMEREIAEGVEALEHREKMLDAMNKAAISLLSPTGDTFADSFQAGMAHIAKCADIDRVCIWKSEKEGGSILISKWVSDAGLEGRRVRDGMGFPEILRSEWGDILGRGDHVNRLVSEMPPDQRAAFAPYEVKAVLIHPVFYQNTFWGMISFDRCRHERAFSKDETDILRSAGFLLANALIRDESAAFAREADERARLLLDTTPLCCQLWDENLNIIDCNEAAVKLYGLQNKREFIERFFDFSPERQPGGRPSREAALGHLQKAFAEGNRIFEWTHKMPDGTLVPAEITLARVKGKDGYIVVAYTRDLRDVKKLETEASKIYVDALTGIYNRRFLDEKLQRIIGSLSRYNGKLSLMMVDIDYFKKYNDTYGHLEGDNCLKVVAETLTQSVRRADDVVVRYGGEEFVIVLPNTDENGACVVADKLLANMRNRGISHAQSDVAEYVTVSAGITTGNVHHTQSGDDYIKRADEMLYQSKQNGRDRYTFGAL